MKNSKDSSTAPYELRTLIRYEIADGCPQQDDKIAFTIPIKGIEHITPTLKNVFNKFSVRYFIKLGIYEVDKEDMSKIVEVISNPFEVHFYK